MGLNKGPGASGRGFTNKPVVVAASPEEWAHKHGGRPVVDLLCDGVDCHVAGAHVHSRDGAGFFVDPVSGVWDRNAGRDV